MNKSNLIADLAKGADLPLRKSEEIVNLAFETMSRALVNGDRIEVRGFGSFVVKKYKDYTGRRGHLLVTFYENAAESVLTGIYSPRTNS